MQCSVGVGESLLDNNNNRGMAKTTKWLNIILDCENNSYFYYKNWYVAPPGKD